MANKTEEAMLAMLTKEGKEVFTSCNFSINTLARKSFRVKKMEREFVQMAENLALEYRKQCPKTAKDWNILVIPSFLNMVACGIEKIMDREK